ncbi:MAG: T9SS type A sorting domain-containing protein [Ignavibacteria bacterium]|nr:T9SS type A sorting domain-containing protein [Ignavibacteria bacterium]
MDGMLMVHQNVKDSGIVLDQLDSRAVANGISTNTLTGAWSYDPPNSQWFTGPDTTAVNTAKLITGRQFQSQSLGMSFPTVGSFRSAVTRVKANGSSFTPVATGNPLLNGGPLRKIQIVFGTPSQAYRYGTGTNILLTDTNLNLTPYRDMVSVPFSVFAVDDLDSSQGAPRQLNVAFIDADNSGTWDPDGTPLGGYEFTYILASTYDASPSSFYTSKNPGIAGTANGFTSMDIMYAWLPRVKTVNGALLTWTNGDKLTVTPYRITRPNFVPGYPVKYSWQINGTSIGNPSVAASSLNEINAYPNPHYAGSRLEPDPFTRFIYFSHLPSVCNIYIYTLDGTLIRTINRNNTDPNNSIEPWDLQNFNQIPVASGMYIVYIDAGSLGSSTLKIAIFTPEERIQTF